MATPVRSLHANLLKLTLPVAAAYYPVLMELAPMQSPVEDGDSSEDAQPSPLDTDAELSQAECDSFNVSQGSDYICGLSDRNGMPCRKRWKRADRFKYHLHDHFERRPYKCADSPRVPPKLVWYGLFMCTKFYAVN